MNYTRMPVIAWSDLYEALELQYGSQFVEEEDLSEAISEDSCSQDELVYFYIKTDRDCDADDINGVKANALGKTADLLQIASRLLQVFGKAVRGNAGFHFYSP